MTEQLGSGPRGSSIEQWSREPFEDGFNLKAVLGGLFFAFIMLPGALYMALVAGAEGAMTSAGQWVTVILFTEIARRSFTTLKRQEIIVLQILGAGLVVAGGPLFSLLWNQYLMQSPYVENFELLGELSKPENIWICPPRGSPALAQRNLFSSAFLPAILVVICAFTLGRIQSFTLGYTLFRMTSDMERLPFPMAPIAVQGAAALADSFGEGRWRWRVFSIGNAIGILFGMVYIVIPTITGGVMNKPLTLLPIPFIDLAPRLSNLFQTCLLVGLSTNLAAVFVGFVLPWPLVKGQFTGSMLVWLVVTPLLYSFGFLPKYKLDMDSIATGITVGIDFWLSGGIGLSLVVAVLGLWVALSTLFKRTERNRLTQLPKGRGDVSILGSLMVFVLATVGSVWLCSYLVPDFPWWIFAIYGFLWTPLNSYISARLIGLTGTGVAFPYIREGSFVLATRFLNYQGISVWFAPIPLGDHGFMAQHFREMELTRTSLWSIMKAQLFIFPLVLVCSLLFCGFLWRMDPIPGSAYPFAAKMWPQNAFYQCLWATATQQGGESQLAQTIKPHYILATFIAGFVLLGLCKLARADRLFFYGMIGAAGAWPHFTIPVMTGALLGRYVFARRFGADTWKEYAPVICAGCICGIGLAGMVAVGLTLVVNSVVQLPY